MSWVEYWAEAKDDCSVDHLAAHSVETKAAMKVDNWVVCLVATTVVMTGERLVESKVAKWVAATAEHWVVQTAAYSVGKKVVQRDVN